MIWLHYVCIRPNSLYIQVVHFAAVATSGEWVDTLQA